MPLVVVFDEVGSPEVLHIVDEPVGEPGPDEVRVRIEAFAINRLDQMMRGGAYPGPFRLPHARLGCEGTGTVDAVGPGVDTVAVGDPVIITAVPQMDRNGTYAESTIVPAASLIPRPAGMDAVTAAALWVAYSTAYGALIEKAGMRPGDHVVITAASGAVGLAAIQVANQVGAVPLAVTRHVDKVETLLAAGASAVVATDEEDVVDGLRRHVGPAGADMVLDSVMGPGLAHLARAVRPGGTLVTAGWLDPRPATMPGPAALTIHSYVGFELLLDPVVLRRMAAFIGAGVRTGALRPTVDTVYGLQDIVEAHRRLELGDHVGKLVVNV